MQAKILQTLIINGDTLLVFTKDPETDISEFEAQYNWDNPEYNLWYDIPVLYNFDLLGNKYKCIMLWYDKCDDSCEAVKYKFDRLIK